MSTFVNGRGGGITHPQEFKSKLGVTNRFDGINDLRNFAVTSLPVGTQADISYHTTTQDRGAGAFLWSPESVKEDNDGSIVKPTGRTLPGRWIRSEFLLNEGFVDIRWFGAVPEITTFDNSVQINRAIQALPLYFDTSLVVNGGYMRRGACFVPTGNWYIQNTIISTGGVKFFGEGPNATYIRVKANSPSFMGGAPKTLVSAVLASGGKMNLTLSAAHGVPIGNWASGWVDGVSGTNSIYLNSWFRLKAISTTAFEILFGGSGSYTVTAGKLDLDAWIVDSQVDIYNISMNNTFGTVIENIALQGNALAGNNTGCSGLHTAGAQLSYAEHVFIQDVGKIGTICDVGANNVWVADSIKGPGFMQTQGPAFNNGIVNSEHHNPNCLYNMALYSGEVVPRSAFYLRGSSTSGTTFRQAQGETSPMEFVIDTAVGIRVDLFNINGPGPGPVNGFNTTMLYLGGDSYGHVFGGYKWQGVFANVVNDQSDLAVLRGENGIKQNLETVSVRDTGNNYVASVNLLTPYFDAYANDAAAAADGVQVGMAYRKTDGTVVWRQA